MFLLEQLGWYMFLINQFEATFADLYIKKCIYE